MNELLKDIVVIASDETIKQAKPESTRLIACFSLLTLFKKLNRYPIELTYLVNEDEKWQESGHCTLISKQNLELLALNNITEKDLVSTCSGQYCLGDQFVFSQSNQNDFFLVDGDYGVNFNQVGFQHYFSYAKEKSYEHLNHNGKENTGLTIDDFSLAVQMIKQHRFVHPNSDPSSILSTFNYGINVNTQQLVQLIEARLKHLSLRYLNVNSMKIEQDKNAIQQIDLTSASSKEETLKADFYIDCTTQKHQQILGVKALTTIFSFSLPAEAPTALANKIYAYNFGWIKKSYLANDTFVQLCCSSGTTAEQATQWLNECGVNIAESKLSKRVVTDVEYKEVWQGNRLGIDYSNQLEPILGASLDQSIQSLIQWVTILPSRPYETRVIRFYNQAVNTGVQDIRHCVACYYALTKLREHAFWQNKVANIPASVNYFINLFKETGDIPEDYLGHFNRHQWRGFLLGFNALPLMQDPLMFNEQNIPEKVVSLRKYIQTFTHRLPSYHQYLETYRSFNE